MVKTKPNARVQTGNERSVYVVEIEDDGQIGKLALKEGQICWEGFRKVGDKLVRGVPKRNPEDCFRYCCHEGCEFI